MATLLAAVMAALLVATGCGSDRDALTIYSGRSENLVGPLLERFSEETEIPIDVRYGETADLALLIDEEGDRTPADVYWSVSPGGTAYLAERGRLAPLPRSVLDLVDPRFEDPEGRWVGVSGRQRVLVYNRDLVEPDELPATVEELTQPRYRGRVALAPSYGSFQDFVAAMRQIEGDEATAAWLRGMARNDARVYASDNAVLEAVARGEVPMGLANHYYNYRFLAEDPGLPSRIHQFAPGDVGGLVLSSTMSVLEGTEKPEEAERLIAFMLSEEAQRYFAEETFEYPLARGVETSGGVPPLSSLRPPEQPLDALVDLEGTVSLIAESGLN
jgi:iron(III) transport system substrate-binding protein